MRRLSGIAVLALLGTAGAATAAQVVPKVFEGQIRGLLILIRAPELAQAPTRLPAHFAFASFSVTGTPPSLDLSFADQRYLKRPTQAKKHRFNFDAAFFRGSMRNCGTKASKTLHAGSEAVYSDGTTVWRCVRTAQGRVIKESATGHVAERALADLVVSTATLR